MQSDHHQPSSASMEETGSATENDRTVYILPASLAGGNNYLECYSHLTESDISRDDQARRLIARLKEIEGTPNLSLMQFLPRIYGSIREYERERPSIRFQVVGVSAAEGFATHKRELGNCSFKVGHDVDVVTQSLGSVQL
jgi:hypothetical protein